MFNKYDAYNEATKNARVNTYGETKSRLGSMILNLFLIFILSLIGYNVWTYMNNNSLTPSYKTKVMGVSHVIDENDKLMMALENVEVDIVLVKSENKISVNSAISEIVNKLDIKDESQYTHLISKELKKESFEKRISDELKLLN